MNDFAASPAPPTEPPKLPGDAPASPDAPPLPGEVWRDSVWAVSMDAGEPRGHFWLPLPNGFWANSPMAIARWALSLLARAEAAESALAAAQEQIRQLLASATPHPVHHPTMWTAWKRAQIAGYDATVIETSDAALAAKLLGVTP